MHLNILPYLVVHSYSIPIYLLNRKVSLFLYICFVGMEYIIFILTNTGFHFLSDSEWIYFFLISTFEKLAFPNLLPYILLRSFNFHYEHL